MSETKINITPEQKETIYTAMLMERLCKIKQIIGEQGEENFYIAFSGGKDSTVLSALIDEALPENKIPRVYADTGIEYNEIVKFVKEMQEKDDRIVIIKPSVPIKQMLEKDGYPFKSKFHAKKVHEYQNNHDSHGAKVYLGECVSKTGKKAGKFACPESLRYQFNEDFKMKISHKCCDRLKKEPVRSWLKENHKKYKIVGVMKEEGGARIYAKCLAFTRGKLKAFQPLAPLTKKWEEWFIKEYNVKICKIYYPPYNFNRTGCKGCPFNPRLQKGLNTLQKFFPKERAQCERIWKPVYDEYRRIGYRLKPIENGYQMTLDELMEGNNESI